MNIDYGKFLDQNVRQPGIDMFSQGFHGDLTVLEKAKMKKINDGGNWAQSFARLNNISLVIFVVTLIVAVILNFVIKNDSGNVYFSTLDYGGSIATPNSKIGTITYQTYDIFILIMIPLMISLLVKLIYLISTCYKGASKRRRISRMSKKYDPIEQEESEGVEEDVDPVVVVVALIYGVNVFRYVDKIATYSIFVFLVFLLFGATNAFVLGAFVLLFFFGEYLFLLSDFYNAFSHRRALFHNTSVLPSTFNYRTTVEEENDPSLNTDTTYTFRGERLVNGEMIFPDRFEVSWIHFWTGVFVFVFAFACGYAVLLCSSIIGNNPWYIYLLVIYFTVSYIIYVIFNAVKLKRIQSDLNENIKSKTWKLDPYNYEVMHHLLEWITVIPFAIGLTLFCVWQPFNYPIN